MILPCILQAISIHISIHKTTLWLWPVRAIPLPWSSCKTSAKQHLGVVVEGKIRTLQKRPFKPVPVRFAQDLQDFRVQILDKFRAHLGLVGPHWVSSRLGRSLHAKTQPMRSWHSWACLVLWMVLYGGVPQHSQRPTWHLLLARGGIKLVTTWNIDVDILLQCKSGGRWGG